MIRRAWILLLCVAAASATDFVIEDPNCDDTLTVTMEQLNDPEGVNVIGCPGSFLTISLSPMIDDPDPSFEECFVFYGPDHPELEFDDSLDDPIVVNSEGNVFTINCNGPPPFEVIATGVPADYVFSRDYPDGNGTGSTVFQFAPNQRRKYTFGGGDGADVLLDVDLNFHRPSMGYAMVRNSNGRMLMLAGQTGPPGIEEFRRLTLAVPSGMNESAVELLVVTQNSEQDYSAVKDFRVTYYKEYIPETTTPDPNVTVLPTFPDDFDPNLFPVELFVVAVDEQAFVTDNLADLEAKIRALANPDPAANNCTVSFPHSAVSCRQTCWMTSVEERGCVLHTADVLDDVFCAYDNIKLRNDLNSDRLSNWADQYGAGRITVDDCMQEATEWIWMAVLMPIAVLALMVGGFFGAKAIGKRRRAQLKKKQNVALERGNKRKRAASTLSGRLHAAISSAKTEPEPETNGGGRYGGYRNQLEIVDE